MVEPTDAGQVYQWLLSANVPLEFEISNMFWDSVKRYLCDPCLLLSLVTCHPLLHV